MKRYQEITNSMQTRVYRERLEERIDLKKGNLVLDHTDFEWGGELMPVSIHHVYNSLLSNYHYTGNASIGLYTADFSAMKLGFGWRLNIMQSMVEKRDTVNGELQQTFIHTNEVGEQIVFNKTENVNEYASSEDSSVIYDDLTKTITDGDIRYVFDLSRLVEIRDVKKNASMNIIYENGKITKVTDGVGREFKFEYNGNGNLTKIIAPDNSCVVCLYESNLLLGGFQYGISSEDNVTTLYPESKISFSYSETTSGTKWLYQIGGVDFYDENGQVDFQRKYTFSNGKFYTLEEYDSFSEEKPNGVMNYKEIHFYSVNSGCVRVQQKNDKNSTVWADTHYAFDSNGNIVSKYCEFSDGENVEMLCDTEPSNAVAIGTERYIFAHQNFIMNSELYPDMIWDIVTNETISEADNLFTSNATVDEAHISTDEKNAAFLQNSLIMHSQTPSLKGVGYSQPSERSAGTYTFSAYVKTETPFESTDGACGVYLTVTNENGKVLDVSESVADSQNGFVRISTTFTLATAKTVSLNILMNGAGTAYVSAPQLEENSSAGEFNMFDNGSISYSMTWGPYATADSDNGFSAKPSLQVVGGSTSDKYVKRTVYPKSAKDIRESFEFSAWVKASRIKTSGENSKACLRAVINYSDTTTEEFTKDLIPEVTAWQKVVLNFAKNRYEEVSSLDLYFDYNFQTGTVYVDDIALIRTGIETEDFTEGFHSYPDETGDFSATDGNVNVSPFEEAVDGHGNTITETLFEDGCFGAFYRSFAYSENGNDRIGETDTRGFTTHYAVDSVSSRVTSVIDKCGNVKVLEYDKNGKVSKITEKDSDGNTLAKVSLEYDINGNVTKATRGDGMEYSFSYNNSGLLTNADGVVYTYRSGKGSLKSVEYENGDKCTLSYDRFGRLAHETWTKNETVTHDYRYAYDREGNLVSSLDMTESREYNYVYEHGVLSKVRTLALTITEGVILGREEISYIRFTYNKDGSVKKKEYSSTGICEEYRYSDSCDTVKRLSYRDLSSEFHSSTDHLGRRTTEEIRTDKHHFWRKLTYFTGEVTPTHEANEKITSFPETNLVNRIDYSNGRSIAYEYDAEGRITSYNDSNSGLKTYTYDAKGQLKTSSAGGVTTLYQYDSYGNLLARGNALSDTEIADDDDKISYVYGDPDHPDRLTRCRLHNGTVMADFNYSYDEEGNPTMLRTVPCEWEKGRQLKRLGGCTFYYNSDGIRTSREVVKTVDGEQVPKESYQYEYEGTKLIRQVRVDYETGRTVEIVPVYDTTDSPIGVIFNNLSDDTFVPRQYWFVKNLQGDILSLLDEDGAEIVRYTYNDWGRVTVVRDLSGEWLAHENPFRWRGYVYDKDTALYYLITRYYDSKTGRFINEDDHAFLGASGNTLGYNLYAYCENDPVNCVDPTGRALATATIVTAGVALAGLFLAAFSLTTGFKMAWENAMLTVITGYKNRLRLILGIKEKAISLICAKLKEIVKDIADVVQKTGPKYENESEHHHIVAKSASRAQPARDILAKKDVNIGINDSCNMVWLKKHLHKSLHTKLYYDAINDIVITAYNNSSEKTKNTVIENVLIVTGKALKAISDAIGY